MNYRGKYIESFRHSYFIPRNQYWYIHIHSHSHSRRSNQSILKEISPGISLEGMMLKLKLQYFGHLMRRVDWCWEGLGARGEGDDRGWDGWMASLTPWMWVSVNSGSWWWTGRPGMLRFMGSQRVGHDWATDLIWSVWSDIHITFIPRNYFIPRNQYWCSHKTWHFGPLLWLFSCSVMFDSFISMECRPPGSSVHRISQERILEWVAISFFRGSSEPGIKPMSPGWHVDSLPLRHLGNHQFALKFKD